MGDKVVFSASTGLKLGSNEGVVVGCIVGPCDEVDSTGSIVGVSVGLKLGNIEG